MKAAFEMAKTLTGEYPKIDYVNTHGTSTPVGDKNETAANKRSIWWKRNCPLSHLSKRSNWSLFRCCWCFIEAIMAIKALNEGIIPQQLMLRKSRSRV